MSSNLPAIDGQFLYNGELFADVGNMNRHKRASVDEIKQLLRPNLNKKNTSSVKDPVAHWWEAQLVHYGLPVTKDKARAKMRLLDSVNDKTLVVPQSIKTIESNLAKKYSTGSRKSKSNPIPASPAKATKPRTPTAGAKRKASHTNDSEALPAKKTSSQQAKKPKITQSQTTASGTSMSDPAPRFRTKQTARKQTSRHHGPQPPYALNRTPILDGPAPSNPVSAPRNVPRTKQTARKQVSRNHGPQPPYALNRTPRLEENEPTPPQPHSSPSRSQPSIGLINGIYDITCPSIPRVSPTDKLTITFTLDTPTLWGAFDFSTFNGIFYLPRRPFSAND